MDVYIVFQLFVLLKNPPPYIFNSGPKEAGTSPGTMPESISAQGPTEVTTDVATK